MAGAAGQDGAAQRRSRRSAAGAAVGGVARPGKLEAAEEVESADGGELQW
jgi:hypothetical protein